MPKRPRGVTSVEVLFVLGAVAAVPVLVLPAISASRGFSRATASADNLRILGAAHLVYAADWNGRQLTFVDDAITSYGDSTGQAFPNYWSEHGGDGERTQHPPVALGWGRLQPDSGRYLWLAYRTGSNTANASLTLPIVFEEPANIAYFGSFRMPNAVQFHQYLGGRFYDPVFYAPKDTVVTDAIGAGFDDRDQYWNFAEVSQAVGDIPAWSSYCLSPAAMFTPAVMAHDDPDDDDFNGWVDPWTLADGFASPSYFHAAYPALKTHMLEHHWLQDPPKPCNPSFNPGTYGEDPGCEPFYFNHGFDSRPMTLFYDGHVDEIRVSDAIAADEQVREQQNEDWGLWSADTPWGEDGYLSEYGWDSAVTSFHILTTDGILGRDITAAQLGPSTASRGGREDVRRRHRRPAAAAATPAAARFEITGE